MKRTRITILIADDEKPARFGLAKALKGPDFAIIEAENGEEALRAILESQPQLVFLDLNMPVLDGKAVLSELASNPAESACEIIVVTANDNVKDAIECIRLGAADYITKPYEVERLRAIARRALERQALQNRVQELEERAGAGPSFGAIVGSGRNMTELFRRIEKAAATTIPVLIRGETGTGKELVAREIHNRSDRSQGPFVAVNTAAIAESLAESELFGHIRGAFTGADSDRAGVFEEASGGTLFLDEIGDMPLPAQAKILRTLQEATIQRVGSSNPLAVDVRVISATHQDLASAMDEGTFRSDLFYRIRGIELQIPPLRRRREDVLLLARHFVNQHAQGDIEFSDDAVTALLRHAWPGNVRELEQTIKSALAMRDGDRVTSNELGLERQPDGDDFGFSSLLNLPLTEARSQLIEQFERAAISQALECHNGNVSAAARQLGIHRQNLQQKMLQLGIQR